MTDGEWMTSEDATALLRAVQPRATERKLRLLACAVARTIWDQMPPGLLREAVVAGELHADGQLPDDDRQAFIHRLYAPWGTDGPPATWFGGPPWAEATRDDWAAFFAAKEAVAPWQSLSRLTFSPAWVMWAGRTGRWRAVLIRDIFGPDPAAPPAFDPAWRTPDAVALAGHVYGDRSFDRLPDLAAALANAGCTDTVVLDHCLTGGPHARGCWVVDLVLGKG